jgi:ribonuclease P protein component
LPREHRLARASELHHCLQSGRRRRGPLLEFIWADNSLGHPRMGMIVPKHGENSVARNRLRRRLKEVWRTEVQSRQPAWDLVIRATRAAYAAPFDTLRHDVLAWRDALCPPTA